MGRRNVVNKGTLNLTAPNYAALSEAIDDFQNEERLFYKSRANELSEYPGVGSVSKADVEILYDNLLGDDPWNYLDQFNSANNPISQETDATTDYDGDADRFYIRLPEKLGQRVDNVAYTSGYGDNERKYIEYNPGTGHEEVDLLFENIDFFKEKGSSGSVLFGRSDGGNYITYFEGFGEVPSKYQSNNQMNGRIAHMKRLIGSLWNDQVKPYWNTYSNELNEYNQYVGGGLDSDVITGTDPDRPWEGVTNDFKGYNRIDEISSKLIREVRGYN